MPLSAATAFKVALVLSALGPNTITSKPLRVIIECGSREDVSSFPRETIDIRSSNFKINSFCDLIHEIIPKAVKDGKFVDSDDKKDQLGHSNDLISFAVPPPIGFIPDLKFPRLKKVQVPNIKVPQLRKLHGSHGPLKLHGGPVVVPKLNSKPLFSLRNSYQEDSSAERMERFKKGLHKMLHVVKVLGQIDQYLSERTRIVIDKLAKTFNE